MKSGYEQFQLLRNALETVREILGTSREIDAVTVEIGGKKLRIVTSEAIAPDEIVYFDGKRGHRWTKEGGGEKLSEYQRQCIEREIRESPAQ